MSLLERIKPKESAKDGLPDSEGRFQARTKVPKQVEDRVRRARERAKKDAPKRDECWSFWRGNLFAYLNDKGLLSFLSSGAAGIRLPGKPSWRSRLNINLFRDHVESEVSTAVQRTPSYQVVPATADAEDISAAKLSQKMALFGHDKWNVPLVAEDTARHAIVADEGFAWPFWDASIGPFVDDGEGGTIGLGDITIRVFGANQVGWEPGVKFERSAYHYVEYATPPEEVEARDDFMGGKLTEDADAGKGQDKASDTKLVAVTEYLERPSVKHPYGRWLTLANDRVIAGQTLDSDGYKWRPYPCAEYGYDGIVLHQLCYYRDSDSDRSQGMGRDLLDPMRIYADCMNKLVEWKNLLLMPRFAVAPGALGKQRLTGEPGQIVQVPQPNDNIKQLDAPNAPQTLFDLAEQAKRDMARIAAQDDLPDGVESGKGVATWFEKSLRRREAFRGNMARWYQGLMMHCLYLVQRHYTEPRQLKIKGGAGWESIDGFMGADLRSQVDVRVFSDSLEPVTRQGIESKVMAYADRQWITPERAMQAIEQGTAEKLIEDLQYDHERANRIIQRLKQDPEKLLSQPEQIMGVQPGTLPSGLPNPTAGFPLLAPYWMPREFDNIPVQKYVLENWMKTEEYESLPSHVQEIGMLVYQGLLHIEAQKAARQAAQQTMMAQSLGEANAARPQGASPLPDQPQVGDRSMPTPNQPLAQAQPV